MYLHDQPRTSSSELSRGGGLVPAWNSYLYEIMRPFSKMFRPTCKPLNSPRASELRSQSTQLPPSAHWQISRKRSKQEEEAEVIFFDLFFYSYWLLVWFLPRHHSWTYRRHLFTWTSVNKFLKTRELLLTDLVLTAATSQVLWQGFKLQAQLLKWVLKMWIVGH